MVLQTRTTLQLLVASALLLVVAVAAHRIEDMMPLEMFVDPENGEDDWQFCGEEGKTPCKSLSGAFKSMTRYNNARKFVEKKPFSAFVVQMMPGVYTGPENRNIEVYWNVTIRSYDGPGTTTIDLESKGRAFFFQTRLHEFAQLEGLTIVNGAARWGGALLVNQTHISMRDVTIRSCVALEGGGAMYAQAGWHYEEQEVSVFENCVFEENRSGAEAGALALETMRVEIRNCKFLRNEASTNGGAVHSHSGQAMIYDSEFVENRAITVGGAVEVHASHVHVSNSLFIGNYASIGAGLLARQGIHGQINDCKFLSNHARVKGAAVDLGEKTVFHVRNTLFKENVSGRDGGAISVVYSELWVKDSQFENNALNVDEDILPTLYHLRNERWVGYEIHCSHGHLHFSGTSLPPMNDRENPIHCDVIPTGTRCMVHGLEDYDYCPRVGPPIYPEHLIRHRWHVWLRPYFGHFFDSDLNCAITAVVATTVITTSLLWVCFFKPNLRSNQLKID